MLVIGQQITCLDIESEISKDERVGGGEGPEEEEEEGAEEGNLDRKSFHGSGSVFWIIFASFFCIYFLFGSKFGMVYERCLIMTKKDVF